MPASRITMAGLVTLVAVGAGVVGAADIGAATALRRGSTACTQPSELLTQLLDGRISGCVRLGLLAAGPHTVVVQQILNSIPAALPSAKRVPGGRPLPTPTPPPHEPAVAVSLSPASGTPGSVVTVTGRLRRPFGGRRFAHVDLCWAGCAHGLAYSGVSLHWSSPTVFRGRLVVPAAPWVRNGSFQIAPLVSGRYSITVQCLRTGKGCDSITEGGAAFALRDAHPPTWCRTQASCALLRVTPAHARPGQPVRVSGFAPLASVIGSDEPFVYQTQTRRGRPRGPQVRFSARDGTGQVTFGRAPLSVIAPPRYDRLPDVTPIGTVSDGVAPVAADPANPSTVAWCQGASIEVDTGAVTTTVPTTGVARVLTQMGFAVTGPVAPRCAAVAPIDTAAGTPAGLAAAFSVGLPVGVPPTYDAAVVSYDGGQTWAPVPVPSGSVAAGFGGFRYRGAAVEAVFATRRPGRGRYPILDPVRTRAEITSADGRNWAAASEGCPAAGPCVTLTPFSPGNCAMNGSVQPVVRSTDGGRLWSELEFPPWVQACGQATLVALSARSELLIDSTSTYPVLATSDGGASWHDVQLPARGGNGDITVLPDGSLVMSDEIQYDGRWKLLRRGARAWCALTVPRRALQRRLQVSAPVAIDGALWWLSEPQDNPGNRPATISQVPLTALSC